MIVIEIADRSYFEPSIFPKEGSYLHFENLLYQNSFKVNKDDLSFKSFEHPLHDSTYDLYRLTTKSCYRLTQPSYNEHT